MEPNTFQLLMQIPVVIAAWSFAFLLSGVFLKTLWSLIMGGWPK